MDEKQLQIEDITAEMASWLMDEEKMTRQQALRAIYTSDTYAKLQDVSNGLFAQSTPYIYCCLQHELKTGKIGQ